MYWKCKRALRYFLDHLSPLADSAHLRACAYFGIMQQPSLSCMRLSAQVLMAQTTHATDGTIVKDQVLLVAHLVLLQFSAYIGFLLPSLYPSLLLLPLHRGSNQHKAQEPKVHIMSVTKVPSIQYRSGAAH